MNFHIRKDEPRDHVAIHDYTQCAFTPMSFAGNERRIEFNVLILNTKY